jgi:hypothetical protein
MLVALVNSGVRAVGGKLGRIFGVTKGYFFDWKKTMRPSTIGITEKSSSGSREAAKLRAVSGSISTTKRVFSVFAHEGSDRKSISSW